MAKSETEGAAAQEPKAKAQKQRSKLLILGVPVFVLLMGCGAGAWWYFNQPAKPEAVAEEKPSGEESAAAGLLSLETLVVNLADIGGRKCLRVTMGVEVSGE